MPSASTQDVADINLAVDSAVRFFSKAFQRQSVNNVELEEVDRTRDGRFWLITLGYDLPIRDGLQATREKLQRIGAGLRPRPVRKYRVVKVDAASGMPLNVKIRPGLGE